MIESSIHTESALDASVPSHVARKMLFAGCEPRRWWTAFGCGVVANGSESLFASWLGRGARVLARARGDVDLTHPQVTLSLRAREHANFLSLAPEYQVPVNLNIYYSEFGITNSWDQRSEATCALRHIRTTEGRMV